MADRFPLILNTSTNQIQEIPSGDNLDLTGVGINNVGVITSGNVQIGAATTDLVVTGDARITGILTVGTSSLKLDGPNNLVNVGTALTLGHTQGLQFHTQNLHSAGFEVNQINASGIITATGADINGDLDVDGHTNLDNLNVVGVVTVTGAVNASHSSFGNVTALGLILSNTNATILFTDTNADPDYSLGADGGVLKIRDTTNNADRLVVNTDGHIDIVGNLDCLAGLDVTGNATVSGNLSVGGVLTYEDVTNVDSVGIITARQGVRLGVDGTSSANYISVGAGNDLKIWHQSSNNHSYISETGSGSLIVLADDFYVQDTSTATMISAKEGAEVNLHFNGGSPKLSTTNTGITVTGGGVFSSAITASTYIQGTSSNGGLKFYSDSSASKGVVLNTDDHLVPTHDSNSDLGLTGTRWRNVYADTLYGDGSNITALNASNLASGTVPIARLGASGTKSGSTFLAGDNTFKTVTVAINSIANDADNRVITSDGDGTATAESNLQFDGTNLSLGIAPGQHYYDRGIAVHTGGTGAVLHLTDSTSGSGQTNGFDIISHAGSAYLWQRETLDMIFGVGGQTKWTINSDGDFLPHNNGTQDIGSSGKRIQNFYTSDLHLSNEAKGGNSIDNTWGDYTIQEGESDLFLINNRSGKKYKFNLTEVS